MINAILAVKADAERELLYAQAKLDVANEILAKVDVCEADTVNECDTETVESINDFTNI